MAVNPQNQHDAKLEVRWAAIRERMETISDALTRQGSIASRSTPAGLRVYSIRYVVVEAGGHRVQKGVYLGQAGELVRRATELLGEYRDRERWVKEAVGSARFAAATASLLRRLHHSRRTARRTLDEGAS